MKAVCEIKKRGLPVVGMIIGDVITDADREYKAGIISYIHNHEMERDIYMSGFRRDVVEYISGCRLRSGSIVRGTWIGCYGGHVLKNKSCCNEQRRVG